MVEKGFCEPALTEASGGAKRRSKLQKISRMQNRYTVISFAKSYRILLLRQLAERKIRLHIMLFLVLLLLLFSCNHSANKVDIDSIDLEIKIKRLEKELFELPVDSVTYSITYLENKFGHFYELFNYVINIGETNSPYYAGYIKNFISDRTNREVFQDVIREFPDIDMLEKALTEAFKHYKYYFSEKTIPDIYTFISGFNASVIIDTNILAIGLDRYLGTECEYYIQLGLPEYKRINMYKEKIVTDCMFAWVSTEWYFNEEGSRELVNNVLNNIIHEGKLIYLVKSLVPQEDISIIMGFSADQIKFCRRNEKQMWTYLIEHKLLFSSDRMTVNKLIGEAPFTSYFPSDSPGRAAVWIGYRVVEQYMRKNPGLTLIDLMENNDYQLILEGSGYNPRDRNK